MDKNKTKALSNSQQELFQKQQSTIYPDLGRELFSLIPEHWNSATLQLENMGSTISHTISSDEGHKEVVTPSIELFEHTHRIELLFKKYDCMFKKAVFKVWYSANQEHHFSIDYIYST